MNIPSCKRVWDTPLPPPTLLRYSWQVKLYISSVQLLSHVWLFRTPWTAVCQASLSITNSRSFLKLMSIEFVMPSNHLVLFSPSPPTFNHSQHQGLFKWVSFASGGQSIGVSASASILPTNIQDWFPLRWVVGSPCCPKDSPGSSPTPQFKIINSLACAYINCKMWWSEIRMYCDPRKGGRSDWCWSSNTLGTWCEELTP